MSTPRTAALEAWFRSNDGYLHPAIQIVEDDASGVHYRATDSVEKGDVLVSAPHSISLSYINALVDDELLVFREQRTSFQVEAIGFFYLMAQYLKGEESFWKPYLDSIPQPVDELVQPLFFEEPEDVLWLEATDVWHTVLARKKVYRTYYENGIATLRHAGVDVSQYTWHLFLWAATIFTSRSFSSRALHPARGNAWTAYTGSRSGDRQAVMFDMSRFSAEDSVFPVLFPGLDSANHKHSAQVDWTFDPDKFTIATNDCTQAGQEVFNNYGPKDNGELLIGYGFCIPDNPYDTVALTLKPPPVDLQQELVCAQPSFFNSTGKWSTENTTFRLARPPAATEDPAAVFDHLPEPLLELLAYILRYERGLPFEPVSASKPTIAVNRYLPQMARIIAQSLMQKLSQLRSVPLPSTPANRRQKQAAIYRNGQLQILQDTVSGLKAFTRSLIWTPSERSSGLPNQPCLVRLEHFIHHLQASGNLDPAFLPGIEASAGSQDLRLLLEAGWEEDLWVLLLSYMSVSSGRYDERLMSEMPDKSLGQIALYDECANEEQVQMTMEVVRTAAAALPNSPWADLATRPRYVAEVGGEKLLHDSFTVMCVEADGGKRPRLFVYFHLTAV